MKDQQRDDRARAIRLISLIVQPPTLLVNVLLKGETAAAYLILICKLMQLAGYGPLTRHPCTPHALHASLCGPHKAIKSTTTAHEPYARACTKVSQCLLPMLSSCIELNV